MAHGGLKRMWRYHVIRALRQAHREGRLRFPKKAAHWAEYPRFNSLLRRLYEIIWYAHIGVSLCDPRFTLGYIGRYTKRAVLAEYRITDYDPDRGLVRFAFRDYAQGGKTSYKTMPVLAFIGRLIRHIPDKHFKMVRYAGLFATRWRQHLAHARAALGQSPSMPPATEETRASLPSWRERRLAEGKDPLQCPICRIPLCFVRLVFGAHEPIAEMFRAAGRPLRLQHPAWDTG
jgi:Putative transposase